MHQKSADFEKLYYPIDEKEYLKNFEKIQNMNISASYKAAKWGRLLSAKLLTEKKKEKNK